MVKPKEENIMILRNMIRGTYFSYSGSSPYGQKDVKCMPDNSYKGSCASAAIIKTYGTSGMWDTDLGEGRIIISEDEVTPDKEMYTMPFKDIIPDSGIDVRSFGYVSDTTSGSTRPRKVLKQSYTNSTDSPITVKTLGLVIGDGLYGADSSSGTTVEDRYNSGVWLAAVQPLDEPVTIAVGETKTFQMTLYLCE